MMDLKTEQDEVWFCQYCGTKLDIDSKFCKKCGKSVVRGIDNEKNTGRNSVYEGNIHKCPNCGEVMEAFMTNCPSCGYEIRDSKSVSSVRELATKLERIENQKMPDFKEKKSVMKMVFGRDFNDEEQLEKAKRDFMIQKENEKAGIIINYSVPNTKEDILEFMLLASSNIDVKKGIGDRVSVAWLSKLEQVYEKAKISMGNTSDFEQIERIYSQKKKQIRDKKISGIMIGAGCFLSWFFLLGLLWNPVATISITIGVIVLIVIVFVYMKKK